MAAAKAIGIALAEFSRAYDKQASYYLREKPAFLPEMSYSLKLAEACFA
ncbi:MAG: hypothetical protein ACUVWQ_08065 [Candidatus Aminicenantales bacterium]